MPPISEELIDNLANHGVVVYPTTTLPGLGCLPNKTALDKLFLLKQRPTNQPVSLGVADIAQAEQIVEVPQLAKDMLEFFPQGSLTLILDAKQELDQRLGGHRVAVRVLADNRAIELVKTVGPITATSANHSGVEPVYDTEQAAKILGLQSHCVVSGKCPGGSPSTIVSIEKSSSDPSVYTATIMREGVIPRNGVETWMMSYR